MKPTLSRQQLLARKCGQLADGQRYTDAQIHAQLPELPCWTLERGALERSFAFRDYYQTLAFVNALAWMVHGEDHHPELTVGYNRCTVRWLTHSVDGVSLNDFICAAKTDAVFGRSGKAAS